MAEVVELTSARGDQRTELEARLDLTAPLLMLDRAEEARDRLNDLVPLARQVREDSVIRIMLGGYVATLAALGEDERAARLEGARWAANERLYGHLDHELEEWWVARDSAAAVRGRLSADDWDRAVTAGRRESLESALDMALS